MHRSDIRKGNADETRKTIRPGQLLYKELQTPRPQIQIMLVHMQGNQHTHLLKTLKGGREVDFIAPVCVVDVHHRYGTLVYKDGYTVRSHGIETSHFQTETNT